MDIESKVEKMRELVALVKAVGSEIQDDYIARFVPEMIDGHIHNVQKGLPCSKN